MAEILGKALKRRENQVLGEVVLHCDRCGHCIPAKLTDEGNFNASMLKVSFRGVINTQHDKENPFDPGCDTYHCTEFYIEEYGKDDDGSYYATTTKAKCCDGELKLRVVLASRR